MTVYTKNGQKKMEASAVAVISNARPDLLGKLQERDLGGYNSDMLVAGDELFKVPSSSFGAWRVAHEIAVIKHLYAAGLPVPEITFDHKDHVLFGMKRVTGEHMTPAILGKLSSSQYESVARSLGSFMAQMELAFKPRPAAFTDEYDGIKVDRTPYPSTLKDAFKKVAEKDLVKAWGEDGLFLSNLLHAYHEKYKNSSEDRKVMSHCDLRDTNIFFDRKNPDRISAVIDFEISGFRLPEQGFREMWKCYPPKFIRYVLDQYGKERGQEVPIADVAAAMCNLFLVKGDVDIRTAIRKLREGFPELEYFSKPQAQANPAQGSFFNRLFRGWK